MYNQLKLMDASVPLCLKTMLKQVNIRKSIFSSEALSRAI